MAENTICFLGKNFVSIQQLDYALPLVLYSLEQTAAWRGLEIPRAQSCLQVQTAYVNHQLAVVHFQGMYILQIYRTKGHSVANQFGFGNAYRAVVVVN